MEKMSSAFLFTFLLVSCLFLTSAQAEKATKTPAHALHDLYRDLFSKKNSNDSANGVSLFGVNGEVNDYTFKILTQQGSKEGDLIERLPGQPSVQFNQYGGYVTVDEKAGRAFYYYFAETEKNDHSKPLLLWLNGGPACSSLAYGAMSEIGPFRVHSDGKTLYRNPFAWNKAANVLFLESPAGVGFSYSNTSSDVENGGDRKTSKDNYVFLLNWLDRFPEYKDREFYISGEGYAGHYVPQLASDILFYNYEANKTLINLKGIIIGNPAIDHQTDMEGLVDYLNTHALLSDELLSQIKKSCDYSTRTGSSSEKCEAVEDVAFNPIGSLDMHNIYYPLCHNPNLTTIPKKASVLRFDPCNDHYVYAYMNNPQVQESLHANITKISYDWQPCSKEMKIWRDSALTVIPLLEGFIHYGLRVWIYSGDQEALVSVTSTKYSLRKMNLTVKTPYHPWYLREEVGGFTEEYEGLTFVTVRGAGRQVPSYQPARALSLIKHFLLGTQFSQK